MSRTSAVFFLAALLSGCAAADTALNTAIDRAARRTGAEFGEAVGQRAGSMLVARLPDTWTSQWMSLYTNYLFNIAFHSGSYSVVEDAYEPGEWTRWRMVQEGESTPALIERALLARTEEGDEWWRVKYVNTETDEAVILEGLFDPEEGELLRLRGKFPGEEAKELPVEEGAYAYAEPIQLSEESLEGATVGVETVTVPAGTFDARHVKYGSVGTTLEWWLEEDIPGRLVKYLSRAGEGSGGEGQMPASWTVELASYGDDAESELGVL